MKPAIVVTGAASGIGRAIARVAAREGSAMVLLDITADALDELAAELRGSGTESYALCIDLADRTAIARIEARLVEIDVYCDVLVNSAGFGIFGFAMETDPKEHVELVDVNIRAVTDLTLRFLPGMIARGRGGVLNIASITGYTPGPQMSSYFASKAYVRSFTAALATEVAGTGVTVTCLSPGVVRTAFFQRFAIGHTRLYKLAPRSNAPETAEAAWGAFKAKKRLVIPRLVNRAIVAGCLLLPNAVLLRLISILLRLR
jgi:uncharacterized protein